MVKSQIWRGWNNICQKNVILTVTIFVIGIFFQLAASTIALLVISVAIISTWWQWHASPLDPATKVIKDTLKDYPAVLIEDQPHLIAFGNPGSCLAAAYSTSVPRSLLKHALPKKIESVEAKFKAVDNFEFVMSQVGTNDFLLVKVPINPYTRLDDLLKFLQSLMELLELQLQTKFYPAEQYQTLYLFGLEKQVRKTHPSTLNESALLESKKQSFRTLH